jgi:hypothetical protein
VNHWDVFHNPDVVKKAFVVVFSVTMDVVPNFENIVFIVKEPEK